MTDEAAEGPRLDLSIFTPYRLVVLARAMSGQLGAAYEGEGITIAEWRVLAVAAQAQRIAARDVVARTPMDKMAVSRAVASLESKGLVVREIAADRRVNALSLSAEGRAVFNRVAAIALGYEASLLSALRPEESRAFFAALSRLEWAVGDKEQQAAAE